MSFVAKLFGVDTKAQERQAQQQAAAMQAAAEATKKQSMAIADQAAAQTRLAQERNKVAEQVMLTEQAAPETAPEIDVVAPTEPASRRRKAFQSPSSIRI